MRSWSLPRRKARLGWRAILTPGGESRYVALFVTSRFLSAGSSAVLGIASFAVAGAANVGTFAAVAAVFAFAGGMGGGWLAQSVLRYGQLSAAGNLSLLRWSFGRGTIFATLSLIAGAIVVALRPSPSVAHQFTTAALTLTCSGSFALLSIQQAKSMAQHHGVRVIVNELGRATSITAPPLLVSTIWTEVTTPYVWRCLVVSLVIHGATLIVGAFLYWRRGKTHNDDLPWPASRTIANYGIPLGLWIGLAAIYQNSDRVILAWMTTDQVAGEYSLVYDISSRGLLLPITALSGAASASVLRMFNRGQEGKATRANRALVKTQASLIGIALAPVIGGALLATRTLAWFTVEHVWVTGLTYLAAGVWTLADTVQRERLGTGNTTPLVKWLAIVALGGIVVNIAVIPQFGMVGAAVVTLASSTAYAAMLLSDRSRHHAREFSLVGPRRPL